MRVLAGTIKGVFANQHRILAGLLAPYVIGETERHENGPIESTRRIKHADRRGNV